MWIRFLGPFPWVYQRKHPLLVLLGGSCGEGEVIGHSGRPFDAPLVWLWRKLWMGQVCPDDNSTYYLLRAYCVPGTSLNTVSSVYQEILRPILWGRCYSLHFPGEEVRQKTEVSCEDTQLNQWLLTTVALSSLPPRRPTHLLPVALPSRLLTQCFPGWIYPVRGSQPLRCSCGTRARAWELGPGRCGFKT